MKRLFALPLARWGFSVLALLAIATGQPGPFLFCAVLAAYAWRCARPRRR